MNTSSLETEFVYVEDIDTATLLVEQAGLLPQILIELTVLLPLITWISEICLTSLKRYFEISRCSFLIVKAFNFNYNNYYLLIINYNNNDEK